MYARVRVTLLVCSLVLASCASAPPHRDAVAGPSSGSGVAVHESVLANMVAVVAAMGGNNPNPGYHAITTQACGHHSLFLSGPQALDLHPASHTLQTATVSAPCQRIAAIK